MAEDTQEKEYYTGATINIDEIAEIGSIVGAGNYKARLIKCDGKLSQQSKPMVEATFEIMEGDNQGLEIKCFYSLVVTKGKNGKLYSNGLMDMKAAFAAIGDPLPAQFPFPVGDKDKAAKIYAKKFQGKTVELKVTEEQRKDSQGNPVLGDDGQPRKSTRVKVVGAWGSGSKTVAAKAAAAKTETKTTAKAETNGESGGGEEAAGETETPGEVDPLEGLV